jgi:hypothetical protein
MSAPKEELLKLVADGKLDQGFTQLLAYTQTNALGNWHARTVELSARQEQLEKREQEGIEDPDELRQAQNAINKALIQLIHELPDPPPLKPGKKPQGISEHRFKNQVLYLLLSAKMVLVIWLFTLWESGAFTNEQFISVIGIIVPVFATYLTLVVKDATQHRHTDAPQDNRLVKRSFQMTAYWLIGTYTFVLLLVINLRGQGILNQFGQMTAMLSTVESGLGVYIGQIVFALFKKEE